MSDVIDDLLTRVIEKEPVEWRYHIGNDVFVTIKAAAAAERGIYAAAERGIYAAAAAERGIYASAAAAAILTE